MEKKIEILKKIKKCIHNFFFEKFKTRNNLDLKIGKNWENLKNRNFEKNYKKLLWKTKTNCNLKNEFSHSVKKN